MSPRPRDRSNAIPLPRSSSVNIRNIEKKILDEIIGVNKYDSRIRPMGNASVGLRGGGKLTGCPVLELFLFA